MTPAAFSTRYAGQAAVCTADGLAAAARVAALRAGGCAVDAAISAGAVLAVTQPHQCGLGGDPLGLVHRNRELLVEGHASGPRLHGLRKLGHGVAVGPEFGD